MIIARIAVFCQKNVFIDVYNNKNEAPPGRLYLCKYEFKNKTSGDELYPIQQMIQRQNPIEQAEYLLRIVKLLQDADLHH